MGATVRTITPLNIPCHVTFGAESVELNTVTLDITRTADYTDDAALAWPAAAPWPANP